MKRKDKPNMSRDMFYSGYPRESNPSSFSLLALVGNSDLEGVMYITQHYMRQELKWVLGDCGIKKISEQ